MKSRLMIAFLLILSLHLSVSLTVAGCPGGPGRSTIKEYVDYADVVLEGIIRGEDGDDPYTRVYAVHVESYLKGEGPSEVLITGYGDRGMAGYCRNLVSVGQKNIFLLHGDTASGAVLEASYFRSNDSLMAITDENREGIKAVVNHEAIAPYSTPVWTLIKTWTYSPVFKVAVLIGIPLIVLGSAFAVVRARRRPTKKKNDAKA